MFKYLLVLFIAGGVIYVSQQPELLELSLSSPSFKVWVDKPFFNSPAALDRGLLVLNVQSKEDKPLTVTRVLANQDPKCVNTDQPQSFKQPMKLGQTLKFSLGFSELGACNLAKVVISTDRGDAIYKFD